MQLNRQAINRQRMDRRVCANDIVQDVGGRQADLQPADADD
jgi:hypothetical protein